MGLSMSPSYTRTNEFASSGTWGGTLIGLASISYPFFSPYNEDGSYAISEQIAANQESDGALCENPVAWANMITNNKKRTRIFGNFYTEVKLFDFLRYKINLGSDYNSLTSNYFNPSSLGAYRVSAPKPTESSQGRGETLNYLIENTLTFNKSLFNNTNNIPIETLRKNIGILFQTPTPFPMTIYKNISLMIYMWIFKDLYYNIYENISF